MDLPTNSHSDLGPRVGNQMPRIAPILKKDIKQIANQLEDAIGNYCPVIVEPYKRVVVLAIRWETDDMGVDTLEKELLDEFGKHWNFIIKSFVIPYAPGNTGLLAGQLAVFLLECKRRYDEDDTLMIVIYSGHGIASSGYDKYYIGGKFEPDLTNPEEIRFNRVINFFAADYLFRKRLEADVCYIFNSCFAVNLAPNIVGKVEVLAATSIQEKADNKVHMGNSFMRRLIDILQRKRGSTSFGEIFAEMATDAINNEPEAMPVYFPRQNRQQIQLRPFRLTESPDIAPQRESVAKLKLLPASGTRVLVSVQLEKSVTPADLEAWKNRLQLRCVSIEALFGTTSQLVLLAMPIQIWTMLPIDDTAWSYVGIVDSKNRKPEV